MNSTYSIRAERRDGSFLDLLATGATLERARAKFEEDHPDFAPFDWRGLVVFCEDSTPAEGTLPPVLPRSRLLRASSLYHILCRP